MNSPKYTIANGAITNKATGEPIPDDEPVFILRAKDLLALPTLERYAQMCVNTEHWTEVRRQMRHFDRFAVKHRDRMKVPDTHVEVVHVPAADVKVEQS